MKENVDGKINEPETVIMISRERMDKALTEETIYPPKGMTREETRQFIIGIGREDGNGTPR